MINAQEKERARVAAELHDDFSQRLALLAFELGGIEEALPPSSDGLNRRLQKLQESASELGADLHTVSHRLHSSTLEALGLVPGVSALCKEFAAHQGIPIDFSSVGIPAHVNPDVALCLFRIVQEALQNLKKHSGAAKAQVALHKIEDRLILSVIDEGRGFEVKETRKKAGLGIGSMRGRARLLGGQFEIHSEPGKGARIEVWVPLEPQSEPTKG
jgi:signal transduction histidine kinase